MSNETPLPILNERERVLTLIEARIRRKREAMARYPAPHPNHHSNAAGIFELETLARWVSRGVDAIDVQGENPGVTP